MKKKESKTSQTIWWILVALMTIGLILTCFDGMINFFGCDRAAQYTWNAAYILVMIPLFGYGFVTGKMEDR